MIDLETFILQRRRLLGETSDNKVNFVKGKKISQGAYGVTHLLNGKGIDNRPYKAVMKTYFKTNKEDLKGITNELKATNMASEIVRQRICPHFVTVLNLTDLSSNQLLLEYIDGMTLYKWVDAGAKPASVWYSVVFQILAAVYALYNSYNLIHDDLHGENIMLIKIKPGGYLKYTINKIDYYVPNMGYFVYIIDFGMAYQKGKLFLKWLHYDMEKYHRVKGDLGYVDYSRIAHVLADTNAPNEIKTYLSDVFEQFGKDRKSVKGLIQEVFQNSSSTCTRSRTKLPYCYTTRPAKDIIYFSYDLDRKVKK